MVHSQTEIFLFNSETSVGIFTGLIVFLFCRFYRKPISSYNINHRACRIMAFLICQRVDIARVHIDPFYLAYFYRTFHIFVHNANSVSARLKDCSQYIAIKVAIYCEESLKCIKIGKKSL